MHQFLHFLAIIALLGGMLPPAAGTASSSAGETQEEAPSPHRLRFSAELGDLAGKSGMARLRWEVSGWEKGAGLALGLRLPAALTPLATSALQPGVGTGSWRVELATAAGSLQVRLGEELQLPLEVRGELWQGNTLLDSRLALLEGAPEADDLPEVGSSGGEVSGLDGQVTVVFPAGALAEEAGIRIQRLTPREGMETLGDGLAFEILAAGQASQKAVHQFSNSLIIQVKYDPALVQGDENALALVTFDAEEQDWKPLPGWVDPKQHILYGRTNHLSVFSYTMHTMDLARLPSLKSFETALFSGAATYSYPLELPPGPGGLQPELALAYNSQVVDGAGETTQASWVGMGWLLETGSITRNMNGTSDYLYDDTFTLTLGEYSSQLVPGADGAYHTQEERFWRILKNNDDTWTAWDTTGMVYEFGAAYPSGSFTDLAYDMVGNYPAKSESRLRYEVYKWEACDNGGQTTWVWPLVKVRNPFQDDANNYLLYTYWYDYKTTQPDADCDDQQRYFAHAFYPQAIYYPTGATACISCWKTAPTIARAGQRWARARLS